MPIIEKISDIDGFSFFSNFIKNDRVVIVSFIRDNCEYCPELKRIVSNLAKEKKYKRFKFIYLRLEKNKQLFEKFVIIDKLGHASFYKITSTPTTAFILDQSLVKISGQDFSVGLFKSEIYAHILQKVYDAYAKE